jgi:hypothetical protein
VFLFSVGWLKNCYAFLGELSVMRKLLWIIAVVFVVGSVPVLRADTTYIVNQTFPVDGQTVQVCSPPGSALCTATTGTIAGFITTDGNVGALSVSDITGFDLANDYGAWVGTDIVDGVDGGQVAFGGGLLYASSIGLFFTTASGGGTLSFAKGNGHDIFETVCTPVFPTPLCDNVSNPPALSFFSEAAGESYVTGSIPLATAVLPFATVAPEPSTAMLCFLGLAFIALLRKRFAFLP